MSVGEGSHRIPKVADMANANRTSHPHDVAPDPAEMLADLLGAGAGLGFSDAVAQE
jgi:hypothetical protein